MKLRKRLKYFGLVGLLRAGLGVSSAETQAAETLESSALRVELNTAPYSYRVIERFCGEVLVSESGALTFTSNGYTVRSVTDVTKGSGAMRATLHLEGTSELAQASFTLVKPEVLQIVFSFKKWRGCGDQRRASPSSTRN
jgi:hypothetical protein